MTDFAIAWTPTATRALAALPERVATAAIEFIYVALAEAPTRVGKPLRFELEGLYSARRGEYRIVYSINSAGTAVTIIAVGHRADFYRRR